MHLCRLGEWKMILETYQQIFGHIWIIQSRAMIFQRFDYYIVCRPLRWHSATICDVTTEQLPNGTVRKFHNIFLFMKMYLPPTFVLRYVRPEMIVLAFMIELDQPDY